MIHHLATHTLKTKYGIYTEHLYYDGQKETIAIFMGDIKNGQDVLVRVHSSCLFAHAFNSIECDCREQMAISQQLIQKEGRGVIIWMEQEGKGNGHMALMNSMPLKKAGMKQPEAYEAVGFQKDARNFAAAAKILKHLEVQSVKMLTNNPKKVETLTRFGIEVTGIQETIL